MSAERGDLYIENGVAEDGSEEYVVCLKIDHGEAYAVVDGIEAHSEVEAWKNACVALYRRIIAVRRHIADVERI